MVRDILNYLGEVVGQLELPDDTPEEVWAEKLSSYAQPPTSVEVLTIQSVLDAMDFGKLIIAEFGARNVLAGATPEQMLLCAQKLQAVQALLLAGAVTPALYLMELIEPDALISEEIKQEFIAKLKSYLGK